MHWWLFQGHEFIDVELRGRYAVNREPSTPAANQRTALNDVTTTSRHRNRAGVDASDDDDDDDDDDCDDAGYRTSCCAVRLSVCCHDNDKQVSVST